MDANSVRGENALANTKLGLATRDPRDLRGIDNTEIVDAVHERPHQMRPAHNGLHPAS